VYEVLTVFISKYHIPEILSIPKYFSLTQKNNNASTTPLVNVEITFIRISWKMVDSMFSANITF